MSEIINKKIGDGQIIVISEIGENHLNTGDCNQDSFSFKNSSNYYAFAVADGVSTCSNCKIGADFAVATIVNLISKFEEKGMDAIKEDIFKTWKKNFNENWDSYSSTLNFCYIYPSKVIIGKIGDGLVILKMHNKFFILREEDEFYSAETFALGSKLPKTAFELQIIEPYDKEYFNDELLLILLTDGIGKELDKNKLYDFISYIDLNFENKDFTIELDSWLSSLSQYNGDDKTIMVYKKGEL